MSRRLEDLIERIAARSSSDRPAASTDPIVVPSGVADEDEFQVINSRSTPSGFYSFEEVTLLHSGSGVETGPPAVPEALLILAREQLDPSGVGQDARARRAFGFGFWAKVSVDCHIPLLADRSQVPLSIPSSHWIVLRSQRCGISTKQLALTPTWAFSVSLVIPIPVWWLLIFLPSVRCTCLLQVLASGSAIC